MKINAILCHKCMNIVYSRSRNDFHSCDCHDVSVDGGFDYFKVSHKDSAKFTPIQLNGDKLLEQILQYDYMYGNRNISEEFIGGYHGKYRLTENSNTRFFGKLIENYADVEEVFEELKCRKLQKAVKLAKKKGLIV